MKKFKCNGCAIHCELTPQKTCCTPKFCPHAEGYEPVWHEVKEAVTVCNRLPDWVKECAVGYDNEQERYFKVTDIDKKWCDVEYLDDGNGATCDYPDMQKCSEARKRPFNAKEMKELFGKVYESSCCTFLITGYDKRKKSIKVNELWFNSEELINGKNSINPPLIDGKPCYKLEHLKNGEWVE